MGRITSLKTRAEVAYAGIFGCELDITAMSDEEIETVKEQIKFYKNIRTLVRTGDFYRLQSPYDSNYCGWQIVSKDKTEAVVFSARILNSANFREGNIRLDGLDKNAEYIDVETNEVHGGDELMLKGITPFYDSCDFETLVKVYRNIR